MNNLKWLLPRLPLPMLALAASYGVYQFALLFVPWWVALIQAAAFEVTYIGLAMIESETPEQRRRATAISVGAVVVSVLYNSLAGFLHRNGLGDLPIWGEVLLATLHGAPLAIVAYLVADLLLHKSEPQQPTTASAIESPQPVALPIAPLAIASLPRAQPAIKAPVKEQEPTLAEMLQHFGKTREEMVALLNRFDLTDAAPEQVYNSVSRYFPMPDNLTKERFAVLLAELKVAPPKPAPATSLLEELIGEEVAPQKEADTSKLHLSKRVFAILKNRPDISNSELYALLPGENQSSIRKYVGDWRKEHLATSHNGNGRH